MRIESAPGTGTKIRLSAPLTERADRRRRGWRHECPSAPGRRPPDDARRSACPAGRRARHRGRGRGLRRAHGARSRADTLARRGRDGRRDAGAERGRGDAPIRAENEAREGDRAVHAHGQELRASHARGRRLRLRAQDRGPRRAPAGRARGEPREDLSRARRSPAWSSSAPRSAHAGGEVSAYSTLGAREREVLQLVAEGKTSAETAKEMHISIKTVETHRRNIVQKLGLHGTAELTKYAIREGLTRWTAELLGPGVFARREDSRAGNAPRRPEDAEARGGPRNEDREGRTPDLQVPASGSPGGTLFFLREAPRPPVSAVRLGCGRQPALRPGARFSRASDCFSHSEPC